MTTTTIPFIKFILPRGLFMIITAGTFAAFMIETVAERAWVDTTTAQNVSCEVKNLNKGKEKLFLGILCENQILVDEEIDDIYRYATTSQKEITCKKSKVGYGRCFF